MARMQVLNVRRATEADARFIIDNILPEDIAEIEAFGVTVEQGVMFSFNHAGQVWVADSPDGPVCMWGLSKGSSLIGGASAWLMTSSLIDKYSRHFLRDVKPYIKALGEQYGYVENYIDSRHERALRFFQWLGFEINKENGMLIGPQNIPFYKVCLRMQHVR